MKITIEPTQDVVTASNPQGAVPVRLWKGRTEAGVPVRLYVAVVQTEADADQAEFVRMLEQYVSIVVQGPPAPAGRPRYNLDGQRLGPAEHHAICSHDTRRGCNCGARPPANECPCRHRTLVDVPRGAMDPNDPHHPECEHYIPPSN